jgi:hypothetical protein
MENDWIKVYETTNSIEAKIILDMLLENEVYAVELNKRDSSYNVFGVIEIYCKPDQLVSAKHLIAQMHEE